MTSPKPAVGEVFPTINTPVLGGSTRSLSTPRDGYEWMMTAVYRGKHCPLCTTFLRDLNSALPDLNALGVDVLAVSADSPERATTQMQEVSPAFDVGYGLSVEQMHALGLYISGPRNGMDVEAPFSEPGLFVINDQGVLQIVDISNVPFARPSLTSLVMGIRFLRELSGDFPINGTHI